MARAELAIASQFMFEDPVVALMATVPFDHYPSSSNSKEVENHARIVRGTVMALAKAEGIEAISAVIEDGIGTDRAALWLQVNGIIDSPEMTVRKREKVIGKDYYRYNFDAIAFSLLKEFFPQGLVLPRYIDSFLNTHLDKNNMLNQQVNNRIRYIHNRRELLRADQADHILSLAEFLFGRDFVEPFYVFYRVGPHEKDKVQAPVMEYTYHDSAKVYRRRQIEAFLDILFSNRQASAAVFLHDDYNVDFRDLKDLQDSRRNKKLYAIAKDGLNRLARVQYLRGNYQYYVNSGLYTPEQLSVLWEYLDEVRAKGLSLSDKQIMKGVALRYNQKSPNALKGWFEVDRVVGMFSGEQPECQQTMADYSQRKAIGRMLDDPISNKLLALRLHDRLSGLIRAYHKNNANMRDLGVDGGIDSGFLSSLRKFAEGLLDLDDLDLKIGVRDSRVDERFQAFWPESQKGWLPVKIKEMLKFYADTSLNLSEEELIKTVGLPSIKRWHLGDFISFVFGMERELVDHDQLPGFVRLYYRDRLRFLLGKGRAIDTIGYDSRMSLSLGEDELDEHEISVPIYQGPKVPFAESVLPPARMAKVVWDYKDIAHRFPLTEREWEILNDSVDFIQEEITPSSGYDEEKVVRRVKYRFPELKSLAKKYQISISEMSQVIRKIIGTCRDIFGPIPDDVMRTIKLRCRTNEANWDPETIFMYEKMGEYNYD